MSHLLQSLSVIHLFLTAPPPTGMQVSRVQGIRHALPGLRSQVPRAGSLGWSGRVQGRRVYAGAARAGERAVDRFCDSGIARNSVNLPFLICRDLNVCPPEACGGTESP